MGDEDLSEPNRSTSYYHKYALSSLHDLGNNYANLYNSLITDYSKDLCLNSKEGEESSDEETNKLMEKLSKKRRGM